MTRVCVFGWIIPLTHYLIRHFYTKINSKCKMSCKTMQHTTLSTIYHCLYWLFLFLGVYVHYAERRISKTKFALLICLSPLCLNGLLILLWLMWDASNYFESWIVSHDSLENCFFFFWLRVKFSMFFIYIRLVQKREERMWLFIVFCRSGCHLPCIHPHMHQYTVLWWWFKDLQSLTEALDMKMHCFINRSACSILLVDTCPVYQ